LAVSEALEINLLLFYTGIHHPWLLIPLSFPFRPLQKFAQFFSVLLKKRGAHSELSFNLAGVHLARFSMPLNTLCTCYTTEAASGYLLMMA
jgi:hypothetical protein